MRRFISMGLLLATFFICLPLNALAGKTMSYYGLGINGAVANSQLSLFDSTGFKFHVMHDKGFLPGINAFVGINHVYAQYALAAELAGRANFWRSAGEELNASINAPRISQPFTLSIFAKPGLKLNSDNTLYGIIGGAYSRLSMLLTYNSTVGYELKTWRPGYVLGFGGLMRVNDHYSMSLSYQYEVYKTVEKYLPLNNFTISLKPSFHVVSISMQIT